MGLSASPSPPVDEQTHRDAFGEHDKSRGERGHAPHWDMWGYADILNVSILVISLVSRRWRMVSSVNLYRFPYSS